MMDFYLEAIVNRNGFGVTTVFEVGTGVLTGLICELLLHTLVSLVEKKPHLERRIWRQRLLHSFCQLNRLMRISKLQLNHHVLNLAVFLLVGKTSALTMNVAEPLAGNGSVRVLSVRVLSGYKWFGKDDDCIVLQEMEMLERFIDREEIVEKSRWKD
ncbi:hypothetical protein IFM89_032173 [Coptis chinensis]|uniref:Uncharacterized protein n=1 Tax=Coptis chinensis TaxID=261450 RepID=A0A835IZM7_9MAGN|nr:hypothetical protein IFM89_032173 [Coptis chinensis]